MTRKLSLTTAVAVAALSIGAPAAFGEGRLAGSVEPVLAQPDPMIEDGFAQAVRAKQALGVGNYRDAHERGSALRPAPLGVGGYPDAHERGSATGLGQSNVTGYRDAFERTAINSQNLQSNSAVSTYKDAFERAVPPQGSVPVSATSSGTEIEWPQVGVGLGIGLLLALGLGLIMRAVHIRPFAH